MNIFFFFFTAGVNYAWRWRIFQSHLGGLRRRLLSRAEKGRREAAPAVELRLSQADTLISPPAASCAIITIISVFLATTIGGVKSRARERFSAGAAFFSFTASVSHKPLHLCLRSWERDYALRRCGLGGSGAAASTPGCLRKCLWRRPLGSFYGTVDCCSSAHHKADLNKHDMMSFCIVVNRSMIKHCLFECSTRE